MRVLYISEFAFDPVMHFDATIRSILASSWHRNLHANVTGALLVGEGMFAQVLEGSISDLQALLGRITCDRRHRRMLILVNEVIACRDFESWSMAYVGEPRERDIELFPDARMSRTGHAPHGETLLSLLRYLVRQGRDAYRD